MQQPTILFIPVSSTQGVGEYTRSLILAEEIKQQIPRADIHFILNKNTSYGDKCPFTVHYSNHSATKDIPKVKEVLNKLKPHLVIFDCAGRSEQFAHAKSLGAQVIFISQHKKKRARGLKINRIFNTDIHWVVQPSYAIEPLSYYERLKLKIFSMSSPKYIGPVLPKMVEAKSEATLNEYQLVKEQYILFSAGSGGHIVNQQLAADMYYLAAKKYINESQDSKKLKCVMIFGENYPNELPKDEEILCLRSLPSESFISLLTDSKINVISAGDTLLQAINLHKPCVASAVSKDQFSRLSACETKGLVCASDSSEIALLFQIKYLLNREVSQEIIEKMMTLPVISGLDIAISDIKNQLLVDKPLKNKKANKKHLFFISQNYSFAILRPLQKIINERGDVVKWFLYGDEINFNYLNDNELRLNNMEDVVKFKPDICFVPGNYIPSFIPGLKVAIFHGFNVGKINRRGNNDHFHIRGSFDLYCTQGPNTTTPFNLLSEQHKHFNVVETGWPAMDPLFNNPVQKNQSRPVVIMCSTFSRNLTCAPHLYEAVKKLSEKSQWQWLVQFHPKMSENIVNKYKELENENLKFIETDNVLPLLQQADVMLCDTSSVLLMFLLQGKPVVTFNGNNKGSHLINFINPDELEVHLKTALSRPKELMKKIEVFNKNLHPYKDGKSSIRVIEAVNNVLDNSEATLKRKPINFLRTIKLRKKLGYWKW